MLKFERVLVLAPHTDDGEFGCGATLAKLIEQSTEVYYVAFSICETSVPEGFPRDILATEVKSATQVLGIDLDHLMVYQYPVRYFPQHRQDILETLVSLRREIKPDLVFIPSFDDVHQDHQVVSQEALRAFKHTNVLGYEMPWNNLAFTASALVHLEKAHIDKKIEALRQYRSQQHRNYAAEDFVRSLSVVRGRQAGVEYAEAFQVVRWIIR
jgi:LmbE family N-acetylglucosaminyl deacetylase